MGDSSSALPVQLVLLKAWVTERSKAARVPGFVLSPSKGEEGTTVMILFCFPVSKLEVNWHMDWSVWQEARDSSICYPSNFATTHNSVSGKTCTACDGLNYCNTSTKDKNRFTASSAHCPEKGYKYENLHMNPKTQVVY